MARSFECFETGVADTQIKLQSWVDGILGAPAFGRRKSRGVVQDGGCLTPELLRPAMGALLMGTNLQGNDINNGEHVQNVQACLKLCTETSECKAMTYVYPNVNDTQNGTCWLKGEVPPALGNPNMISAKKVVGA